MASRVRRSRRLAKRARSELTDDKHDARSASRPLHSDWRDWASLPSGPAGLVAERVLSNGDVADYVRFRAACAAWRACSDDPRSQSIVDRRFHPRRWIMLPYASELRSPPRCFLNTHTGECIEVLVPVPDLERYYILGQIIEGLLVICQKGTHTVQLLNPLTGQLTDYPHVQNMLVVSIRNLTMDYRLNREQVQSGGLADDSTLALLCNYRTFSAAKPGDESWKRLRAQVGDWMLLALPFAGRLYCVTRETISVVETAADQKARLVVVADLKWEGEFCWYNDRLYPVYDDDGGLILVRRHKSDDSCFDDKFQAYRVMLDTGDVEPISDLGGQALFVCDKRSQSVPAGISSSIRADTVYVCRRYYYKNRPDFVAFDLSGTSTVPTFDRRSVAYDLLSYVCHDD